MDEIFLTLPLKNAALKLYNWLIYFLALVFKMIKLISNIFWVYQ